MVDDAADRSLLIFSHFINFHFYRGESNFILTAAKVLRIRTREWRVLRRVAWRMTHLLESDDIPGVQNLVIDGSVNLHVH